MVRGFFVTSAISTALHAVLWCVPTYASRFAPSGLAQTEIAIEAPEPPEPLSRSAPSTPASFRTELTPRPERRTIPSVTHVDPTPAAPVPTTSEPMAHFTIAIGSAPDAYGAVSSATAPPAPGDAEPIPEEYVDGKARLVFGLSPMYPADARAQGVEGDVRLDLIVATSGAVETARVIQSVAPALDRAALEAAKRFRFDPATRSGHPVRVRMRWSIRFRLRDSFMVR